MDKYAADKAERDVEKATETAEAGAKKTVDVAKKAGSALARFIRNRQDKKDRASLSKKKDLIRLLDSDFKEPEMDLIKSCMKEAFGRKTPDYTVLYRDGRIDAQQIGRTADDAIIRASADAEPRHIDIDLGDTKYPDAAARYMKNYPADCQLMASRKSLGKNADEKIKNFREILENKRKERDKLYAAEIEDKAINAPKDTELLKKLTHMADVKEDFQFVPLKDTGVDMRSLCDDTHKVLEVGNIRSAMAYDLSQGIAITEVDGNFFRDVLQQELNDKGVKFAALTSPEGSVSIYTSPQEHTKVRTVAQGHIISDMSRLGDKFEGENVAYIEPGALEAIEKYAKGKPGISIDASLVPAVKLYQITANINDLENQKLLYPKQKGMGLEYLEERIRQASKEIMGLKHLADSKADPAKIAEELDGEMKKNGIDTLFFIPEDEMRKVIKNSGIPELKGRSTAALKVLKMAKSSWNRLKQSEASFSYMPDEKSSNDELNILFCSSDEKVKTHEHISGKEK